MSVISKIHEIRDGWRIANLNVRGIVVTKMDNRVRGHHHLLEELKAHPQLNQLLLGVIPMNEAVSYAHRSHASVFAYDPKATASKAYVQLVHRILNQKRGA